MKTGIITLLALFPIVGSLSAVPPDDERRGPPSAEKLLDRFDEDDSGALELDELETMIEKGRERLKRFREERRERIKDRMEDRRENNRTSRRSGNDDRGRRFGDRNQDDRRGPDTERLVERFDEDGDGTLNPDEVEVLLERIRERRSGPPRS